MLTGSEGARGTDVRASRSFVHGVSSTVHQNNVTHCVLVLLVATRWCIMRLFVRPMAMRLLHGFKEAPPLLDRVIRSLHPRPTEWDLNNEIEFQNKKKKTNS